ncbi:uncharacterized protein LOC103310573 isoform X2 [Acyrthosiphon pisum]|nr:uncharacterized protein LOC103310573 isoform X2 [Acyrthosiphon pisum]|eukprot:XP_016663493.1 PREDICTED: uncharacterized protein LOC103310573 isoform X2 [Acyrthosiphon pisum]
MASTFQKWNPAWKSTTCIMADKDFVERNVFKNKFTDEHTLICIFHCLRSMSREITTEKMNITLGNRTNNRLESTNQKITQVVTKHLRLDQLFQGLEMLMVTLRTERDHVAHECFTKTPSYFNDLTKNEKEIYHHLTTYAFNKVIKKFRLRDDVDIKIIDKNLQIVTIQSSEGILTTSIWKCSCSFDTSMNLPCHHIFKVQQMFTVELYNPHLSAERWTRQFYSKVCRVMPANVSQTLSNLDEVCTNENHVVSISMVKKDKKKIPNAHEKFRQAYIEAKRLASLTSEATGKKYEQRLNVLKHIAHLWESDINITTTNIDELNKINY